MKTKHDLGFPVQVKATIIKSHDGSASSIFILRNISEQKIAEEKHRHSHRLLRNLATRLADAEEQERKSLSIELHDQVGQNLTALGVAVSTIQKSLTTSSSSLNTPRLIQDTLHLIKETTEKTRTLMHDLRPPNLDDYGIFPALTWYSERFAERSGLTIEVESKGRQKRLSSDVEIALFRIAQEAMTNISKHSHASTVFITLQTEPYIKLSITDDGVGFDQTSQPTSTGLGLMIMKERALSVGGNVIIKSHLQQGTEVIATVGLNEVDEQ